MTNKSRLSVVDAAKILNMNEDAVRRQFAAGRLYGGKKKSPWGGKPRIWIDARSVERFRHIRKLGNSVAGGPPPSAADVSAQVAGVIADARSGRVDLLRRVRFVVEGMALGEFSEDDATERLLKYSVQKS